MNINFKDKKTIALMITAGTLILLTAAIVAIVFLFPAKKIEIPDFSNKSKVDVDAWILENDLTVEDVTFTYEYNETTEKDMVLSQSILAGEKLKKDEVLNIILSNGYDPTLVVTIPDFKDMKYEEIHQWFTDNKFTDVTYEYIPDQKVKKDYFIKSNLTASEAHRNDMILISISVGTESVGVEITMPDFADYTKANIQAWGKTNNMSITFKTEASDKIAKDKIISQTPKAGETTKTGGKVTVTISTGKGTTAVKFDGKTKKDVDAWAKENGIKISYVEAYDNKIANGTVVSNKPNSGTIATGSTMTVNISIGKPSIDNYTNKSKDSFQAYVDGLNKKSANIKISVTEVESDKAIGTILKQTINGKVVTGATTADTGTTVYIEVAKVKSVAVASKAGSSYDDFKKYVEGLGMKVGAKTDRYNDTYNSGIIVSNDTGNKVPGTSINYVQSLGKYSPAGSSFDGKSTSDAQGIINTANNLGAGWTISFSTPEQNSSVDSGLTFGCIAGTKTITCKVSKGAPITVEDKKGTPESEFIDYIQKKGLVAKKTGAEYSSSYDKGLIIANQTGTNFNKNDTINYTVSLGPEPTPEPPKTAVVPTIPSFQILSGIDYNDSVRAVTTLLKDFTNLKFVAVTPDDDAIKNGLIKSISVNSGDTLPVNTEIVIEIYKR